VSGVKEAREILRQRIVANATTATDGSLGQASTSELSQVQCVQGPQFEQSIATTELTLNDVVERYWKPYLDRKRKKPSTRKGYFCVLKKHIIPAFGKSSIAAITPLQIENFIQVKEQSGLSNRTIRNIVVILHSIFSLAVDDDVISGTPMRKRHMPEVQEIEKPVWSVDEVKAIVGAVPEQYRTLFITVAITGLRIGELLALQWKHIDFEKRTLRVAQALWEGQLVSPKSKSSRREIVAPDVLIRAFSMHLENSTRIGPDDFIFCKTDGKPLRADVLRREVLYPTLDRLQVNRTKRNAGFHCFRHTAASLLNELTGNLKLAQNLLGHRQISTTADVYTKVSVRAEREASETLAEAFFGKFVPKCSSGTSTETE